MWRNFFIAFSWKSTKKARYWYKRHQRLYTGQSFSYKKNELVCSSTYTKLLQNYWTIFNFNQRNLGSVVERYDMVCNSSKSILSFKDRQFQSISGSFVQSISGAFVCLFVCFVWSGDWGPFLPQRSRITAWGDTGAGGSLSIWYGFFLRDKTSRGSNHFSSQRVNWN